MDPDAYEAIARIRDFFMQCGQLGEELDKIVQRGIKKSDEPKQHAKKSTSMMSYDVSGINWVEKVGQKGPFMLASERDNKNNKEYEKLFKTIKDRWDRKENTWPFWIFQNGDAIGKNITK